MQQIPDLVSAAFMVAQGRHLSPEILIAYYYPALLPASVGASDFKNVDACRQVIQRQCIDSGMKSPRLNLSAGDGQQDVYHGLRYACDIQFATGGVREHPYIYHR